MTDQDQHVHDLVTDDSGRVWCADCGETISNDTYPADAPPPYELPRADLAIRDAATIEQLLEGRALPVMAWAQALLNQADYEETETSNPGLDIIAAILGGQTSAEVLAATSMVTVDELIGDKPGAHSAVLTITGATVLASTFDEGPSCFAVISVTEKASGRQFKLTCGARAVQAAILAHIYRDWVPFDCILTRRLKPTRKGFYPLNLEAGG